MAKSDSVSKEIDQELDNGGAKERLRERAEELVDDMRQVGRSAKGLAQDAIEEALRAGGGVRDDGIDKAHEVEDRIVEYVCAKPIQSILMAVAAGFILSSIVRR